LAQLQSAADRCSLHGNSIGTGVAEVEFGSSNIRCPRHLQVSLAGKQHQSHTVVFNLVYEHAYTLLRLFQPRWFYILAKHAFTYIQRDHYIYACTLFIAGTR